MVRPLTIIALLTCLAMSGCYSSTRHGDAVLYHHPGGFMRLRKGVLMLPRVPLDAAGTTTFHVRDLPVPMYPSDIQVPERRMPEGLDRRSWRNCRVMVEIYAPNGRCVHSVTKRLGPHWPGGIPRYRHDRGFQRLHTWYIFREAKPPPLTSYDIVITVGQPSSNTDDWLRLATSIRYDERAGRYRDWLFSP